MSEKKHPRKAYVLTAEMMLKEVELTAEVLGPYGLEKTVAGQYFYPDELYDTQAAALDAARKKVADQERKWRSTWEKINTRQANIAKQAAALEGGA